MRCLWSGRRVHDRAVPVTATRLSVRHTTLSMPVSKCSILVKSILLCIVLELEASVAKTAFIFRSSQSVAYRGGRGFGVFKTPPKFRRPYKKSCQTQPDCEKLLTIPEFRTPAHQDIRKKGSKILKPPRFAIVLH